MTLDDEKDFIKYQYRRIEQEREELEARALELDKLESWIREKTEELTELQVLRDLPGERKYVGKLSVAIEVDAMWLLHTCTSRGDLRLVAHLVRKASERFAHEVVSFVRENQDTKDHTRTATKPTGRYELYEEVFDILRSGPWIESEDNPRWRV